MPVSRTDWLSSAPVYPTNLKAGGALFSFLRTLAAGHDLSRDEASAFLRALVGNSPDGPQMAGAITALTMKGTTSDELAGLASAAREFARPIEGVDSKVVDFSSTGSPNVQTFSIQIAACLVAAGAGLSVFSQGRMVSSDGDGIKDLALRRAADPNGARASMNGTGLCFLDARKFHPKLDIIYKLVSRLGVLTTFDYLPMLAHPAAVSRQMIGVWHRSLVEPVAEALAQLGTERAWVVHAAGGLDAITLKGKTFAALVEKGRRVKKAAIRPEDFGLKSGDIDSLTDLNAKQNATLIGEVLASRRRDAARNLVVLNAAALLTVGGLAKDPMHGARLSEQSIDSGQAQNKLERLIQVTSKT